MKDEKDYYERGDIFEELGSFYILMSIPLDDEKRNTWAFNLIDLETGNRLFNSSIKVLDNIQLNSNSYENRCDVIYKSDPLFTQSKSVKYVCSKETMEHILKTLQLISET